MSTQAERLGLVAKWSKEFGYTSLHDPTTGEWHDIPTDEAPDWAKRECFKRRDLYKGQPGSPGNKKAYWLTRAEMEEIWESERTDMWTHPAISAKGIFYEDYEDYAEENA